MPVPTTTAPKGGDTLAVSLMKMNELLYKSGGGGGGITTETDPLSVHTTGGTMTGTLAIHGASSDGLQVVDPQYSNAYQSHLLGAELKVADTVNNTSVVLSVNTVAINGAGGSVMLFYAPTAGVGHLGLYYGLVFGFGQANTDRLWIDQASGDLMVTQTAGPNAGKSVNLTDGHWA